MNELLESLELLSDGQFISKIIEIVPDLDKVDNAVDIIFNNLNVDLYRRLCGFSYTALNDEICEIIGRVYERSINNTNKREDFANTYLDHLEWDDFGDTIADYMINDPHMFAYIENIYDNSTRLRDALWDYCDNHNVQYPDIWDDDHYDHDDHSG